MEKIGGKKGIVILVLACAVLLMIVSNGFDRGDSAKAATVKGKVTATSLNVRTGPGTSYEPVQQDGKTVYLFKDDVVQILGEQNNFYHVKFTYNKKTVTGYSNKFYIKIITTTPKPTATPKPTVKPTPKPTAKATKKPDTVTLDDGEVPGAAVTATPTPKSVTVTGLKVPAKVTTASLRVRTKASTTASQLTYKGTKVTLAKNAKVTIMREKIVNKVIWYYVSFKFKDTTLKGFVHGDYIKLTLSTSVKGNIYTTSSVVIRNTAGVSNDYVKSNGKNVKLKNKKAVTITKETKANSKKWFGISFTYNKEKLKGYLLANQVLLQATPTPTPTVTPKPTATPTVKPKTTATPKPTSSAAVSGGGIASTGSAVSGEPVGWNIQGVVSVAPLNVRVKPGLDQDKLTYKDTNVKLTLGQKVTVLSGATANDEQWYYVSFQYDGVQLKGYVKAEYVDVSGTEISSSELEQKNFEKYLDSQGFPESYRVSLRSLHKKYPQWTFLALHTGLDWSTVIKKESKLKLNLINKSKSIDWKSFETGAYDWSTDTFVVFDGTSWVAPSKNALKYYMDPRNFLTTNGIYQFEQLSYVEGQQTKGGVEAILKDTPLYKKKVTCKTDTGAKKTMYYSEIFLEAAKRSGVNAYHLASRVKQEVVTSKTTLSGSASGKTSGYVGYYNFFNIGAKNTTVAGGAVKGALSYAKNGSTAANNKKYLLPWDSQYKAIVGGALYIGNGYINCGQDTVYLQKFNVTKKNTYSHQYMANIEAPFLESKKSKVAYDGMEDSALRFSIPVYNKMPAKACAKPSGVKNPNNWLKSLSVSGYSLTPKFAIKNSNSTEYTVKVSSSVKTIKINATAVSKLAKVQGTGTKTLSSGTNTFTVSVTAEDKSVRKYKIHIKK